MDLGDIDLVWYYWPQSKVRFGTDRLGQIDWDRWIGTDRWLIGTLMIIPQIEFSEAELRHIFSIDVDKDALRVSRKLEIQ